MTQHMFMPAADWQLRRLMLNSLNDQSSSAWAFTRYETDFQHMLYMHALYSVLSAKNKNIVRTEVESFRIQQGVFTSMLKGSVIDWQPRTCFS